MNNMLKHICTIIILFIALFFTSMVYIIGLSSNAQSQTDDLFDDIQGQVYNIKMDFDSLYKELEDCNNELSNINYDDKIKDIYSKIDDLYKEIESYNKNLNTEDKESKEEPLTNNIVENDISTSDTNTSDTSVKEEQYDHSKGDIYDDLSDSYYGRLYIPDLGIDVALYYSYEQYVTDRIDSANIFCFRNYHGYVIADHNYQEFSKLLDIEVGTCGYIQNKYLGRIDIECTDVFNGYNAAGDIVDINGIIALGRDDYTMYTCHGSSNSILICLWKITKYE